jgi:hypothetical protein
MTGKRSDVGVALFWGAILFLRGAHFSVGGAWKGFGVVYWIPRAFLVGVGVEEWCGS